MRKVIAATVLLLIMVTLTTGCSPTTGNLLSAIDTANISEVQKIAKQINVNEPTSDGIIPIVHAVKKGNPDIVQVLIDAGAHTDASDTDGRTLLAIAEEVKLYSFLAKLYYDKKDYANVVTYGELAIQKDSNDSGSNYLLAASLLEQANGLKASGGLQDTLILAEKSVKYIDAALAANPNMPGASEVKSQAQALADITNRDIAAQRESEEKSKAEAEAKAKAEAEAKEKAAQKSKFKKKMNDLAKYDNDSYEGYTTFDMKESAGKVYDKWDSLLNEIYQYLKKTISSEDFAKLQKEELDWIKKRDAKAYADSEDMRGGTGEGLLYIGSMTESTKKRCEELLNYIK